MNVNKFLFGCALYIIGDMSMISKKSIYKQIFRFTEFHISMNPSIQKSC